MTKLFDDLVSAIRRALLGISAAEIRYTFEDLRSEIRAVRSELKGEIADLRRDLEKARNREDRPKGPEIPVAEA